MERQQISSEIEALSAEQAVAVELWEGIYARSDWLALNPVTIAATIERYQGDELGAAMATDITHALAAELPLDGSLDDMETEPIDGIVTILRSNGLAGISIEDLSDALGVDLSMGALEGIMTMHAALSDQSLGNVALLRERFAQSVLADQEAAEEKNYYRHQMAIEVEADIEDSTTEWNNDSESEEFDEYGLPTEEAPITIVTDESGEEFEV